MSPEESGSDALAPQARQSVPITVSITRTVDPAKIPDATRWVQSGVNLANQYPGFLGSGWVRASADSWDWHMLYRFSNVGRLDAWESSADRVEWLAGGSHLVIASRTERRTGIEGWFDPPAETVNTDLILLVRSPPRWKQAVSIWLGFFPVNLAFTLLVTLALPAWADVGSALKVLITTLVLTPIMAYWVLPAVTRLLRPWLNRV